MDIGETFKERFPAGFIQALFHNEFYIFLRLNFNPSETYYLSKIRTVFLRRSYFMVKLKIRNIKSMNKLMLFGLKINWKKRKSKMNIFSQNV
jgi:hypothetical protein